MVFSFLLRPSSFLENKKVITLKERNMKKETWKFIIQTVAAILTAIATSLGVTSCIAG